MISWYNSHIVLKKKRKERHVKSKILYIFQHTAFSNYSPSIIVYDMVEIKLSLLNQLTKQKTTNQIFQYQVNFNIMPLLQLQ